MIWSDQEDIKVGQRWSASQHSDLDRRRSAGAIRIKRQSTIHCVVDELRCRSSREAIGGRGKMTGIKRSGVGVVGRQMFAKRNAREVQCSGNDRHRLRQ